MKKLISVFLTMLIMLSCTVTGSFSSASAVIDGDVTLDGSLNIKDATAIQKHVALLVILEGSALRQADFDTDGYITVKDATAIQKKIAGLTNVHNNLVTDAYSHTFQVYDYGDYITYDYHIPKINIDDKNIDAVNKTIWNKHYVNEMGDVHNSISGGYTIFIPLIDYEWAVNDNILSLCVRTAHIGGFINYALYNIDITTGKEVPDTRILSCAGYTEAQYLAKAKKVMASEYFAYGQVDEYTDLDMYFYYNKDKIINTLTDSNIKDNRPYLNDAGELCIVSRRYSYAGVDFYYYIYNLDTCVINPYYINLANSVLPSSQRIPL